jgi:hypothetical protein
MTVIGSRSTSASATTRPPGGGADSVRRSPSGPEPNFFARTSSISSVMRPSAWLLVLQQRLQILLLLAESFLVLLADFHLLQPAQAAQPHVQDRLGLHVGQRERAIRPASARPPRG